MVCVCVCVCQCMCVCLSESSPLPPQINNIITYTVKYLWYLSVQVIVQVKNFGLLYKPSSLTIYFHILLILQHTTVFSLYDLHPYHEKYWGLTIITFYSCARRKFNLQREHTKQLLSLEWILPWTGYHLTGFCA